MLVLSIWAQASLEHEVLRRLNRIDFYGAELRRLMMDEEELLSDIRRETAKRKKAHVDSESLYSYR